MSDGTLRPILCAGDCSSHHVPLALAPSQRRQSWVSGDTAPQGTRLLRHPPAPQAARWAGIGHVVRGHPNIKGYPSWRGWQPGLSSLASTPTAPRAHEPQGRRHCWDQRWHRARSVRLPAPVTVPSHPASLQAGRHPRANKASASITPLPAVAAHRPGGKGSSVRGNTGKKANFIFIRRRFLF